jgi:predicted ester cyclase
MTDSTAHRAQMGDFYRRYLQRCNSHRFGELGEFVAADVQVNGEPQGLSGYAAGLDVVISAFPDYHWDLRRLLIDGSWLAAQLADTGTHLGAFLGVPATGRTVKTDELAFYRISGGKITEVWSPPTTRSSWPSSDDQQQR